MAEITDGIGNDFGDGHCGQAQPGRRSSRIDVPTPWAGIVVLVVLLLALFIAVWGAAMIFPVYALNRYVPLSGINEGDLAYWWPFVQPTSLARQLWWVINGLIMAFALGWAAVLYIKSEPDQDDDE